MPLPLAVLAFGLWERQRGAADWAGFDAERLRLTGIVRQVEARVPAGGRPDHGMGFIRNGQLFGGPLALAEARGARHEAAAFTRITATHPGAR